jgi:hypothetical protein
LHLPVLRQPPCLIAAKSISEQETPAGRNVMIHHGLHDLPKLNPCAQCGQPIAVPEWVEEQEDRTIYLWHCHACDYRFEASAFFDDADAHSRPLAA